LLAELELVEPSLFLKQDPTALKRLVQGHRRTPVSSVLLLTGATGMVGPGGPAAGGR
jgi:hypothetical protein